MKNDKTKNTFNETSNDMNFVSEDGTIDANSAALLSTDIGFDIGYSHVPDENTDEDGWTPDCKLDCGEWLKKLRDRAGLSAVEVAGKFNIPYQTYMQWESGRRRPPYYVLQMFTTILNQYIKDKAHKTKNENKIADRADDTLTLIGCPVYMPRCVRIVSSVDEMGDRKYYLTIARVAPRDINMLKYWLNHACDEEAYNERYERLTELHDTGDFVDIMKFRHDVLDSQRAIWTKKCEEYSRSLCMLADEVAAKRQKLVDDIK